MLWIFLLIIAAMIFARGQHRPYHRRRLAAEHLPQRAVRHREFLCVHRPADPADDHRIRQFGGGPRFQLSHPRDHLLHAAAPPRLSAGPVHRRHAGLHRADAGRFNRDSARQVYAVGGCRTAGVLSIGPRISRASWSSPFPTPSSWRPCCSPSRCWRATRLCRSSAALLLLTGYGVTDALTQNLERERLAALARSVCHSHLHPGDQILDRGREEHAVDRLRRAAAVEPPAVAGGGRADLRFRLSKDSASPKSARKSSSPQTGADPRHCRYSSAGPFRIATRLRAVAPRTQFLASVRIQFLGVVKSTSFIVILLAALLNCVPSVALSAQGSIRRHQFPSHLLGPGNDLPERYTCSWWP